jgi:glycosyltransferase involved in cell wall biosynthesis
MRAHAKKLARSFRDHGLRGTAVKVRNKIGKNAMPFAYKNIYVMTGVEDVVRADFIDNPYKAPAKKSRKGGLKIGWVLSPVSHGSGGQNTIVRFSRFLQQQGHDVTFYIYEGIQSQSASEAKKILKESFKFDVRVLPIAQYEESDAVFATGWETAYPVFNINTKAFKFYFVQDYEPLFYGLGSMAVLAKNTYKFGFYGVTAGKWLTKQVSEFGMDADYFDFGVDLDIYKAPSTNQKKKKICFYARPVTERRAFELGVIALDIFHRKHPDYEIEFFGWDVSDYKIPFPYTNRGILSHKELAELYQESVACLVLSLTNVSLLPFELLAAGCIPVMNEGDNNSMVLGENKYITYTGDSPIELAKGLVSVVTNPKVEKTATAAVESVNGKSWEDSYKKVERIIVREVTGKKTS